MMQLDEMHTLLPTWQDTHTGMNWFSQLRQKLAPGSSGTHLDVRLYNRTVRSFFTPAAMTAAAALTTPLTVEMELYFSCFVRKAVRFYARPPSADRLADSHTRLHNHVHLQFSPVTTQHCAMASCDNAPPLESMPVTRPHAFLPRWVTIDYHPGQWQGEFGY